MKQEDKDLLLKDLSGRLPYGIKVCRIGNYRHNLYKLEVVDIVNCDMYITSQKPYMDKSPSINKYVKVDEIKPYLFPLSSMTEEQGKEFALLQTDIHISGFLFASDCSNMISWLNKNHFDYNGLIPKGLAIDCTGLNIY